MQLEKLPSALHVKAHLRALGVDEGGVEILASKMRLHFFYIRALHVGAANILKQDALSIGADLAVPRGTVVASKPYVDAILIASTKALKILSRKERSQPFGLKALSLELEQFLKSHHPETPSVMGVMNINSDSFYQKSRAGVHEALHVSRRMIAEGAGMIDIGALSSRPGSAPITQEEELERIKGVIDQLYNHRIYEEAVLSIDSYAPLVVEYALDHGFGIVNDITGLLDDRICALTAQYGATALIMHMQGTPQTMQKAPYYEAVISEVGDFFASRLEKAKAFGIKKTILDVGIGFGKRLEDNIALIAQLEHFLRYGSPLLVGASRKSMIDAISPAPVEERLGGTLALHLRAIENGAQIIRAHDVAAHVQAIKVWSALHL